MTAAVKREAIICRYGVVMECRLAYSVISNYIAKLERCYTPRVGSPRVCMAFKTDTQPNGLRIIFLPRGALPELIHAGISCVLQLPPLRSFECTIDDEFLLDDQRVILDHLTGPSGPLARVPGSACLDLRAGYGKTFVAAGLIARMHLRTLYIVPTRELARQVCINLRACLGNSITIINVDATTSFVSCLGDTIPALICVAVINTALRLVAEHNIGTGFSLIVFDEAHMYCSSARTDIFWRTQTAFMFGMSATVAERRDGFDFALEHYLHPMIHAIDIPGFAYGESEFALRVCAVRYTGMPEFTRNLCHEATGKVFAHYMYEQFASDPMRADLIADQTRRLLEMGHNIFIFSEERAHVEQIARDLVSRAIIAPELCVVFYGGIGEDARQAALCGAARVIIATYSYSGTGISIVRMTAAILATPRYSGMKQIVGRILRRGSSVDIERVVVDIIDKKTCLAYQHRLRRNAYDFYGATYSRISWPVTPASI